MFPQKKPTSLQSHCITTLKTPSPHMISCLAVHHNLLYAASVNQINVFDLTTRAIVTTFRTTSSSSGSVKSIAFASADKIFTAHQDSKIRVWKIIQSNQQHQLVATLPTVKDRLRRFILPQNHVTIRRHEKRLWIEHCDAVSGLALSAEDDVIMYSVSWDRSLKSWNARNYECLDSVRAHEDAVNAVIVSGDGIVYTASADGKIRVWGRENEKGKLALKATLEKRGVSNVNALALNGNGSALFAGGCDRSIMVWERKEGEVHMVFAEALWGHDGAVLCLVYVDAYDLLVSGSYDQTVRVWRRRKESSGYGCMVVLEGHEKPVKSLVAISRDSLEYVVLVCSGSFDGQIKVWEVSPSNFNGRRDLLNGSDSLGLVS